MEYYSNGEVKRDYQIAELHPFFLEYVRRIYAAGRVRKKTLFIRRKGVMDPRLAGNLKRLSTPIDADWSISVCLRLWLAVERRRCFCSCDVAYIHAYGQRLDAANDRFFL